MSKARIDALMKQTSKYITNKEHLDKIQDAYLYAKKMHEGQFRKSGEQYIVHPVDVGIILSEYNTDPTTIMAGLLHDVIEDTDATFEGVKELFGEEVALLIEGVTKLVLDTIFNAGGKPCPPIIVGIGIGGNLEKSALLAKEALLRDLDDSNDDEIIMNLEKDLYKEINKLGVGPMGVGGETTCLAVKINYYPMHIASLPVAINIQCHSSRHTEVII